MEALEITRVQSVAGLSDGRLADQRPFRAPHHTISAAGLVGGGPAPRPGEITLAHRGVLFLDELAEFSRAALEALRQPLEAGVIEVTRRQRTLAFPARFMLVGACNECPCGLPPADCECGQLARDRYRRRLSGPLLDRIDIVCSLGPEPAGGAGVAAVDAELTTAATRERVAAARERADRRLATGGALSNAVMSPRQTRSLVRLEPSARTRLLEGSRLVALSARGQDRVLRLGRTIADLAGSERVQAEHVDEALSYRMSAPSRAAA